MIINIRGTSGSGKSTLVRRVVELYGARTAYYEEGRKQPLGYTYNRKVAPRGFEQPLGRPLAVVGHYETDCGGCDTIPKMERIFELVKTSHNQGCDVLFEGLLISADIKRTIELHEWCKANNVGMMVVALSTPIDECIASINQRREASFQRRLESKQAENAVKAELGHKLLELPEPRGEVNPRNTIAKSRGVENSMRQLQAAGMQDIGWYTRDGAFEAIKQELGFA